MEQLQSSGNPNFICSCANLIVYENQVTFHKYHTNANAPITSHFPVPNLRLFPLHLLMATDHHPPSRPRSASWPSSLPSPQ
mmetsp:Transcript_21285/g.59196  ORF Transcript_21285/g.59196 Transcript_21285/m.59196 type:complete len:81 (-) Transcript_21285:2-244(-)